MLPTLFAFGPITIYTLNVLSFIGLLGAGFLVWSRAHSEHYEDDLVFDAMLLTFLSGLLAARIGYVLVKMQQFGLDPIAWINIFERPGFLDLAGIVVALVVMHRLVLKQKWSAWEFLDYTSVGLAFFSLLAWIGRFFAGAHLGRATSLPIGVRFPTVFDQRHPVQLYMALGFFIILIVLRMVETRYRFWSWYRGGRQTAQAGAMVSMFLLLFGLLNVLVYPFAQPQFVIVNFPVDVFVWVSVAILGAAMLYLRSGQWKGNKKKGKRVSQVQARKKGTFFMRLVRWQRSLNRKKGQGVEEAEPKRVVESQES